MFTIGGLSGVTHAVVPSDWQQTDTYYIVAHFHYVLFGGAVFGLFAGLYYWFPKLTGKVMNSGWARWHFWLMFLGFNLTFRPMHWLGSPGHGSSNLEVRAGNRTGAVERGGHHRRVHHRAVAC